MATAYSVLGQVAPSATTETQLYLVPSATSAVVSSIVVTNQAATAATYRIAVVKSGGSVSPAAALSWIVYGATVAANDSTILTIGITMATGDQIRVYASSSTLSFNAFGSQIS
jgi:hypothetical protein